MTDPVKVTAPMKTPKEQLDAQDVNARPVFCGQKGRKTHQGDDVLLRPSPGHCSARYERCSPRTQQPDRPESASPRQAAASRSFELSVPRMCRSVPPPAIRSSDRSHSPEPGPTSVANTASAMPTMPYHTARFALSCPDKPPRERMKRTAATTYAAVVKPNSMIPTP